MNMLFRVWYARYKERLEEDDTPIDFEDIGSLIPSPLYFFIGVLIGAALLLISYVLLKLFTMI